MLTAESWFFPCSCRDGREEPVLTQETGQGGLGVNSRVMPAEGGAGRGAAPSTMQRKSGWFET